MCGQTQPSLPLSTPALVSLRRNVEKLLLQTLGSPDKFVEFMRAVETGNAGERYPEILGQLTTLLCNVMSMDEIPSFMHELVSGRFCF